MNTPFKQINLTLNRLEGMMTEQIESFGEKDLPDLEQQSFDRDRAIETLKTDIEIFRAWVEKSPEDKRSSTEYVNNRITDLLGIYQRLEKKVCIFRDNLKKNMQQVSKGKKAIRSYRSSYAVVRSPKVLSITN